jgi:hypothetical protein
VKNKSFCAFILSNGRPDKVYTYKTIRNCGYTGKIYIIIDNEDKTANEYYKKYENVIMFDKNKISKTFDQFDNFNNKKSIVYARNFCFEIAKKLGYEYFVQLDDDYLKFEYRTTKSGRLMVDYVKNLDSIFDSLVEFLKTTPSLTIALAQGGDFIGGANSSSFLRFEKDGLIRKAMNSFVCKTKRPFKFIGRINEDVNSYVSLGSCGKLFFTTHFASLVQNQTQKNKGGMTDIYLEGGTYVKSFYSVICSPSCVKVRGLNTSNKRLHHNIKWKNAVPVIIDEKYKVGKRNAAI